jgi:type I restriction enzyme S subunit
LKRGYDLPKMERELGNVPLVSSSGVSDTHSVAKVKGPGVITGRYGTIGTVYFVEDDFWPLNTTLYVRDFKGNDPRFVSYFLRGIDFHAYSDKAAVPGLNRNDLHQASVLFPSLPEQRAIAATLGALDDKIEVNRRTCETLEAMARALFRDWFVDFGPTRAKMAGTTPYLSPDLWSLFPDRLDDEGKPEGWQEKPLDEIANFLNGLALQKFPGENEANSLPVIKIAELRNGITAKSNRASRKVPSQYVIQDSDFLFSWSGSLLAKFWTGGEGALNQHLFKVSSDRYPAWFFSEWVQHHLEEFQLIAASKATTMGHIQRGHLKAATTICPPDPTIERLGDMMAHLINRMIHNELETRTLAQTRDLLLPRLMSGELRVSEATPEREVET